MDSEGEPPRFYDDPTDLPHLSVSDVWHRSFWSQRTTDKIGSDASSSTSSASSASAASSSDGGRLSDSNSATWSGSEGKRWILENPDFRKLLRSNDATTSAASSSGTTGVGFGRSVSLSNDMSTVGKSFKSTKLQDFVEGKVERRHKLSVVGEDASSSLSSPISASDYRQGPSAASDKYSSSQTEPNLARRETGLTGGRLLSDGAVDEPVGHSGGLMDALNNRSAIFTVGRPDDSVQSSNGYTIFGLPSRIKVSRRELNMMTPSSF